jgi:hypothetical protein
MNLDMSGSQMLQQIDHHSRKRNIEMAQGIHRNKNWSRSLTKDTLTTYQEGLAVKTFDSREKYIAIKKSNRTWLVAPQAAIDSFSTKNDQRKNEQQEGKYLITQYYRVRKVSIDCDGFMSCTCSYTYNYLAPCRHMMAVFQTSDYVVPSLYHLRWWEIFNYYYLTDFGKNQLPEVHANLDKAFGSIRTTQFNSERKFKGCCVKHIDTVGDIANIDTDTINIVNLMVDVIDSKGYLAKGSTLEDMSYCNFEDDDNESIGGDQGFGGLAKTVTVLSPSRLLPGKINFKLYHSTPSLQDKEDYNLVMNMIESAKSQEQKERMRNTVSELTAIFLAENRNTNVACNETTFLGEDDSKGYRSGKRHKQQHETWVRKRKG